MKKKMGRPELPKGVSKDIQVGVRFNPNDDKKIEKAVDDSGQTKSEWVRNAAISESKAPPIWVKSKWTREDLDGKTVEYQLSNSQGTRDGIGTFMVRENPAGKIAIYILTRIKFAEIQYFLHQKGADRIERNPDPNTSDFRILAD